MVYAMMPPFISEGITMKINAMRTLLILASICFLAACGSGGSTSIEGPVLSLSEVRALVIDQFFVNGGLDDEYASEGEFSLYLRDAATGQDVACTSAENGMEELAIPAIYYGGLSVPFESVDGEHPESLARFQLLFVEQDSQGCPEPIDEDEDDIAGISAELTFDELLEQPIWATNGRAVTVLRAQSSDAVTVRSMAPSLARGFFLDKLFFENGSEGRQANRYYLFVDRIENGSSTYESQVSDDDMAAIQYGELIYAALGFTVPGFDAADAGFDDTAVRVSLYVQRDSGPALVGQTDVATIGELIGEKALFTNGKGYVTFRSVMPTPFSASVVRLEELIDLIATDLSYTLTPEAAPTMELQVTDVEGNYAIACAGANQGLGGVDAPGTYAGLTAGLATVTGQQELFGWDTVLIRLVNRTDGLTCPAPMTATPEILGQSAGLTSAGLGAGSYTFANEAGSVTLALDAE